MMFKKTFSALTLAALSVSPLSQAIAQSSAPDNIIGGRTVWI